MKTKVESFILLFILAGLTVLTGCKKEPEPVIEPLLDTPSALEVTVNSALIEGSVISKGSAVQTARGFTWSTSQMATGSDNKHTSLGKGVGIFTERITGLLPGTDYYVRTFATTTEGTYYGDALMITTPLTVTQADLVTLVPENISLTSVVSGGEITDIGGGEISERGICWSTDPSPTVGNSKATLTISGPGSGMFTIKLTGLEPGMNYYLRSYAINSAGVAYGPEVSFRTLNYLGIKNSDFPGDFYPSVKFSIENKLYVGLGRLDWGMNDVDLWEWDKVTGQWTRLADFPGTPSGAETALSIGGKGYILNNIWYGEGYITEFWEYDPASDRWTKKSNLPVAGFRISPVAFSIGSKGYIGLGEVYAGSDYTADYTTHFWEWNQATDMWTRKADFPGQGRTGAAAFTVSNKGYVGTGNSSGKPVADFWEYDQTEDRWTRKANFAGAARSGASGFSIGNKGYIGAGSYMDEEWRTDFWEYDLVLDKWSQIGYPTDGVSFESAGSVGNDGYFFAVPASGTDRVELWTFHLTSDK